MAVLNIRIEDRVRDELRELADAEGLSLSEYVRDLIMAAIVPVREREDHGDLAAPESMTISERQTMAMLHRILARVLPEDANEDDGDAAYQLNRARVIEEGFTGEYWREVAGFRTELSRHDCDRVLDMLDMFRVITYSIRHLRSDGISVSDSVEYALEFQGFDHNDGLEGHMASYVEHLMADGRWSELREQVERNDNGNSHHRILEVYMRMLAEYRRIRDARGRGLGRDNYFLSEDDLQQIADARVHPSHRG